jgi:hypothetical protein
VAVAKNGNIFWTDSSSNFQLKEHFYDALTNPSGRLIHYSRLTGKNTVLLDKLWFANGVALSSHEEFVVVVDLLAARLKKCHLKGEERGKCEIFIEGLPGLVDNLTPDQQGIWLPAIIPAEAEDTKLYHTLTEYPLIRKFLIRVVFIFQSPFEFIERLYSNSYTQAILFKIRFSPAKHSFKGPRTTLIRLDWNGKVVDVMHGLDRSVNTVSHVLEFGDYLYLGSTWNNFIGRVKFVNKDKIHPK